MFGILIGLLPIARAGLGPFVAVASMIPPLALLPILFIVMGLGEASKIALIVIGTTLKLMRDLALRVEDIPREQIIKAQTLGASTWQIATAGRHPADPAAPDRCAASGARAGLAVPHRRRGHRRRLGLGYRIFLVRRYLSMDVIIPYVIWITLLAFLMDFALRGLQRRAFPWFAGARAS